MIVCTEQYYKYFCKPENPKIKIFSTFSVLNNFVEAISLLTLSGLCLPSGLAIAIFYSAHILLITPHTLYTHSLTPSSSPLTHFTQTHSHHPPRPSHTLHTLTHTILLTPHTLYTHSLTPSSSPLTHFTNTHSHPPPSHTLHTLTHTPAGHSPVSVSAGLISSAMLNFV